MIKDFEKWREVMVLIIELLKFSIEKVLKKYRKWF